MSVMIPSWIDHLPDGGSGQARDVGDQALAKAKSDAARLLTQSDRACAEGLVSAAAEATRVAVILKPGSATAAWQPFWPVFAKALRDVSTTRTTSATAGVLSFATLVMSHGGYVPDFFDRQTRVGLEHEIRWLEELAAVKTTPPDQGEDRRLLGFAALAAGRGDLAAALSDDPSLATLTTALTKPAHEATRAFLAFLASFPTAIHKYGELGFVARAFVCHVEKRGLGGIGAAGSWLHRTIREGGTNASAASKNAASKVVGPTAAKTPKASPPIDPALVARANALFVKPLPASSAPPRTTAWKSIAVDDVHALHGGRSIRIDAMGNVETVDVGPGLLSVRLFRAMLTPAALDEVIALLRANPPRSIMTSRRNGVAGEGRPVIELVAATSGTYSVGKWSNDRHPAFDAIQTFLDGIARVLVATAGTPTEIGRWENGRFALL